MCYGSSPNIWRILFNISATAESGDFTFDMPLGFAKIHHKITPRRKVGVALGYGSYAKFGVPFICVMAEVSDFKFDTQLGCAN